MKSTPNIDNGCFFHPGVEANVRCTSCERRICPDCMIDAPVGFKCPECVKGQLPEKYRPPASTLAAGFFIAAAAALATGYVASKIGFFLILSLAASYAAGWAAGEAAMRTLKNPGGKNMKISVGAGVAAAMLTINFGLIFAATRGMASPFYFLVQMGCIALAIIAAMSRVPG